MSEQEWLVNKMGLIVCITSLSSISTSLLPAVSFYLGCTVKKRLFLLTINDAHNVVICDVVVKSYCSLSLPLLHYHQLHHLHKPLYHPSNQPVRLSVRPPLVPSILSTNQDWLRTGKRPGAGIGVQRSTEVVPTMVSSLATPATAKLMLKQNSKDSDGSVSSEGSK